jgi:RNA polymerase sigma factor (sigma-70 family)
VARAVDRIFDDYLVASARTGDRSALGLLAERWQSRLMTHAWRLTGDREAALDAVQSGWVEIVRGLGRLQDERAFAAWAYRIVTRRCSRQIRDVVRSREIGEALAREGPVEGSDPGPAIESWRLRAAIEALPPDQRSAIALFYLEDMSVAEVAVALNVPAGTVKSRLLYARRKLREALEGDE